MEVDEKAPETKASESGPRPKIVRNREVDKAAKELADDYVLPLPPGKTLTWDQMQEWLALLGPAMWNHVSLYLYRLKPKIRRQLRDPNAPSYIDCIGEPFTMDYIIHRHGGGKYQIQACDTDGKKEGNSNLLFKCHFDVNDTQYLPIIDYAELEIEAKENKSYVEYLRAKGILGPDGKPVTPQAPASTGASLSAKDVLDIFNAATKLTTDQQNSFRAQFAAGDTLGKSVGDILLEKMRQDDPAKDWDRMTQFFDRVNKPDHSLAPIIQILTAQLQAQTASAQAQIANAQEQRKTDLEYTRMMLENQRRAESPKGQFSELRDMITLVREIIPSSGGRRNGWETGLEIAKEVVLPGIQTIGNIVAGVMSARGGQPPVAPGQGPARPPAAFDPYRNPQAARQYASTLPQQPQAAPGQAPPPFAPQPPTDPESALVASLQQYAILIANHMSNGTPGYDFGDYVAGLLGLGAHAQICAPGEAALATAMMRIPEVAIFGESRVRQFVHEFINYAEMLEAAAAAEEEIVEQPPEGEIVDMPPSRIFRPPTKATSATREGVTK